VGECEGDDDGDTVGDAVGGTVVHLPAVKKVLVPAWQASHAVSYVT